jgi:hypothetical protein
VSLDLAETYLARGKARHAIRLLRTFHGSLRGWDMHPEGAAWLLRPPARPARPRPGRARPRSISSVPGRLLASLHGFAGGFAGTRATTWISA